MHVAYVCSDRGVPVFGGKGCSIHAQEVLRAFLSRGERVSLFAASCKGPRPPGLEALTVHPLPPITESDPATRERLCLEANGDMNAALVREGPFDLVYERHSLWSYAGMEYARASRMPGVLEINAPLVEEQARYRTLIDRSGAETSAERAFAAASALIAVSSEVADYLARYESRDRIHVIPNGVDPARFPAPLRSGACRPTGTFNICFVGTLKPWHGLATLVEAFAALHAKHQEARLLIVGDGPERENLRADINARGLIEFVDLYGSVAPSEIPGILGSADVGVAPYPHLQGFYFSPLKVYEYMAAGLPVITSRIGQLSCLIENGRNGILCPPGDAAALTGALEALHRDPALRARLGRAARQTVVTTHSWSGVVDQIVRLAVPSGSSRQRATRSKPKREPHVADNPYVFIVGCARSGTTLLQRVVDAHPDLAITPETHWISPFYRRGIGLTDDGFVTPELLGKLIAYRTFPNLGIDQASLEALCEGGGPMRYAQFVTRVFDLYGQARGKRLVGDKSPAYVQKIHTLNRLWSATKFIHLIRDGREVYLSVTNWANAWRTAARYPTWSTDPAGTTALWWKRKVRLAREAGARLQPGLYSEIRYESLVSDAARTCETICDFLHLPYSEQMLQFHVGRAPNDPYLSADHPWQPITSGLRDWRSQMPERDIELFEALTGDLLDELGYERAFPRPGPAARDSAAGLCTQFTQDLRSKGERMPDRWENLG